MGFFDSLGKVAKKTGEIAGNYVSEAKEAKEEGMYMDQSRLVSCFHSASGARKQGYAAAIR